MIYSDNCNNCEKLGNCIKDCKNKRRKEVLYKALKDSKNLKIKVKGNSYDR